MKKRINMIINFYFITCFFVIITQRTKTPLRRLQDVLKRSRRPTTKLDVVKTSGKRLLIYDVLKMSYLCRLEDV